MSRAKIILVGGGYAWVKKKRHTCWKLTTMYCNSVIYMTRYEKTDH